MSPARARTLTPEEAAIEDYYYDGETRPVLTLKDQEYLQQLAAYAKVNPRLAMANLLKHYGGTEERVQAARNFLLSE